MNIWNEAGPLLKSGWVYFCIYTRKGEFFMPEISEVLTPLQIQILLHYLEAEPSKRTVTDAAKCLGTTKWAVTRAMDTMEKLDIVERLENRKTVLTVTGKKLAEKYAEQKKVLEQYMQYQDIPPAEVQDNVLRALAAGFSDSFMERLAEQEGRMRLKELFAGRQDFHGGEICNYLKDGSYYFPFVIYREHIKNYNNISMGNKGFEHPCELIVKDHEGMIYLTVKTVSAESMSSGRKMEGRINKMQYLYDGEFRNAGVDGRYVFFPVTALYFMSMGKGRDTLLHGSVCLRMQCSVGDMHMPESMAVFTVFIH